jgi:hypothetical protein
MQQVIRASQPRMVMTNGLRFKKTAICRHLYRRLKQDQTTQGNPAKASFAFVCTYTFDMILGAAILAIMVVNRLSAGARRLGVFL